MDDLTTPDGWGSVFVEYRPQVVQYVYRRVGDRTVAEDITSEVFVRAVRGCAIYTDRGFGPRPWLLTLASRLIKDHWRSTRRRPEIPVAGVLDTGITGDEPGDAGVRIGVKQQLDALIALLPSESWRACLRLEARGLDRIAVAHAMGRTPKAVKCLRGRAIAYLRQAVPVAAVA